MHYVCVVDYDFAAKEQRAGWESRNFAIGFELMADGQQIKGHTFICELSCGGTTSGRLGRAKHLLESHPLEGDVTAAVTK